MNRILANLPHGAELRLDQELDELGLLVLGDLGKAVDDHKRVVAMLQLDLETLAQVRGIDLVIVELVIVEVCLAQMLKSRRHIGGW